MSKNQSPKSKEKIHKKRFKLNVDDLNKDLVLSYADPRKKYGINN